MPRSASGPAACTAASARTSRTRILAEFKEGTINVLVCTDVAARGIHVDNISLVLHVDPPQDHKSYLHRGGRTARAGEKGTVMTLVLPNERRSTDAMTRRAGIKPFRIKATPGHPRLGEVAGARTPSGEPIPVWEPSAPAASSVRAAAASAATVAAGVARAASAPTVPPTAPARASSPASVPSVTTTVAPAPPAAASR